MAEPTTEELIKSADVLLADLECRLPEDVLALMERINIKSWRDRLALLSRQNEELRKALEPLAGIKLVRDWNHDYPIDAIDSGMSTWAISGADVRRARAALSSVPSPSVSAWNKRASPSEMEKSADEPIALDALLWAWTNLMGRLPDANTMSADEITKYWDQYAEKVETAIVRTVGMKPDEYLQKRAAYRRTAGERK